MPLYTFTEDQLAEFLGRYAGHADDHAYRESLRELLGDEAAAGRLMLSDAVEVAMPDGSRRVVVVLGRQAT